MEENTTMSDTTIASGGGLKKEKFTPEMKLINDCIHGNIKIPSICMKMINTPEFDRLRNIKQMGGLYHVYPGASHNRFEHSIGVCHLAGELLNQIRPDFQNEKKEEFRITEEDVLSVQIAGLCHDLGHGPLSHAFDVFAEEKFQKEATDPELKKVLEHEHRSVLMFRRMITHNENVKEAFLEEMKIPEGDSLESKKKLNIRMTFIQHLIHGIDLKQDVTKLAEHIKSEYIEKDSVKVLKKCEFEDKDWEDIAKTYKEKGFLFEIVANKANKIDVDKFDYFVRDCQHLGIKTNFDHNRFIKLARICKADDGSYHISIRDKEAANLVDLFHTRFLIHRQACFHQVTKIVEEMYSEVLKEVNDSVAELNVKNFLGKTSFLDIMTDMEAFLALDDNIFHRIMYSSEEKFQHARDILLKIVSRNKYKFIGRITTIEKKKKEEYERQVVEGVRGLEEKTDICVLEGKFNYGSGDQNPLESVWFYRKENPKKAINYQEIEDSIPSVNLPRVWQERLVQMYYKGEANGILESLKENFDLIIAQKTAWVFNDSEKTIEVMLHVEKASEDGKAATTFEVAVEVEEKDDKRFSKLPKNQWMKFHLGLGKVNTVKFLENKANRLKLDKTQIFENRIVHVDENFCIGKIALKDVTEKRKKPLFTQISADASQAS